jgi:anti-sigma regulatory factor (Ser/Thr protein kinase)
VSIVEEGLAGPLNDRQREYLGIALRNADTIAEMMEHLLVLTKMQQDSFRLDRRRVNLAELLEDHTLTHGHRPKNKVVTFRVDVSSELPDAYADPDRLLEAVRNLVDNSIKYSGDEVTITIQAKETRGRMLEIRVRDTGYGMDPATRRNLFVRSYRGQHAGRKSPGGLGIGLSIVKEIVDLHDGRITVRSQLDEGTEFRLTLPQFDVERVVSRALLEKWKSDGERGGGFAFVRAGIRESQGALPLSRQDTVRMVREVLRKTLDQEDTLLPDCNMCGAVCFLLTVGRPSASTAVRRILRTAEERLRMQSGTYIEWESKPTWLHSEDFNHLEEMAEVILHRWCCKGERKDGA